MCDQVIKNTFRCSSTYFKKLNIQRQNNYLCDFTLKTQDGGSFPVHKVVLAAVSPFFEAKFMNTVFSDSASDSQYTSKTIISSENARKMLHTALFLGLLNLVEGCTEVLVDTVNKENCLELLNYSETYHLGEKLTKKCIVVILKNVVEVVNLPNFKEMSLDVIKKFVSIERDGLTEESVFLAVTKWISFDFAQREQHSQPLLDVVNFGDLSHEFCATHVFENNPLANNVIFLQKMLAIQRQNSQLYLSRKEGQKSILPSKSDQIKQNEIPPKTRLHAVFNGEMKVLPHDQNYNLKSEPGDYAYTFFKQTNLFICGGIVNHEVSAICKYLLNRASWINLPAMTVKRHCHRAVTLNDKIYVCGGVSEKSVEIFDIKIELWTKGPSLYECMANFGLCTLHDCIYVTYGRSLYHLDTRTINWTLLSIEFPSNFDYCSAIGFDKFIYRFDKTEVNKFDLRNNQWIEKMRYQNKFDQIPHVSKVKDEIYVFGVKSFENGNIKCSLDMYNASNLNIVNSYHMNAPTCNHVQALFYIPYV